MKKKKNTFLFKFIANFIDLWTESCNIELKSRSSNIFMTKACFLTKGEKKIWWLHFRCFILSYIVNKFNLTGCALLSWMEHLSRGIGLEDVNVLAGTRAWRRSFDPSHLHRLEKKLTERINYSFYRVCQTTLTSGHKVQSTAAQVATSAFLSIWLAPLHHCTFSSILGPSLYATWGW